MKRYWSKIYYSDQEEWYLSLEGDQVTLGSRGIGGSHESRTSVNQLLEDSSLQEQVRSALGEDKLREILAAVREIF